MTLAIHQHIYLNVILFQDLLDYLHACGGMTEGLLGVSANIETSDIKLALETGQDIHTFFPHAAARLLQVS